MIVTIPDVKLTLDELLAVIRRLDEPARVRVAETLLETQMDARLSRLIEQLATSPPVDNIGDAEIMAEINSVRRAN